MTSPHSSLRWLISLALVLMAGLLLCSGASAQDARVEAAKKEGKVVWYTSLALTSAEKVAKLFEAAYPGIKVEVHRTGSQRILQRVMQELQANIKNVDVIHTSDAGHYVFLKDKKLLMRYTPAGVESFPTSFKDKDGYHYGLRATVNVIAYNTKAVPAAEAPRTWKDLLDPRWRGKLVTAHPGYSGVIATHVLALVHLYGWDYFKQLAQNKPMLVQSAVDPVGNRGVRRAAGRRQRRRLHVLSDQEEGQSDRDRLPEGGRARSSSRRAPSRASRPIPTRPSCSPTSPSASISSRSLPTAKGSTPDIPASSTRRTSRSSATSSCSRSIRKSWRSATKRSRRASWSCSEPEPSPAMVPPVSAAAPATPSRLPEYGHRLGPTVAR